MKRNWTTEELVEHWAPLPTELEPIGNKSRPIRLGFAVLLKFSRPQASLPSGKNAIPRVVVA